MLGTLPHRPPPPATPSTQHTSHTDPDSAPPVRTAKAPQTALKYYSQYLTHYEQTEILDFQHIYFIGPHAKKLQATTTKHDHHHHRQQQQSSSSSGSSALFNSGYDDENGDYKLVLQDHLMYRYEILDLLGQGSFGQVVKCFDHKTGATVAIKLIRNKKRFHAQALTEIKILRNLVDWDPEDKHHNIRMTDYFYFRHHLCIAFECMSMNLYEFIKKNNFQGFSVGLIRK
jgi:dual specificity tyrosine-phosphorylation-regulated kinase 2/3/4